MIQEISNEDGEKEVIRTEATEKDCKIADEVIEILVKEKCTIDEAQCILSEVCRKIQRTSIVQKGQTFSSVYHE